MPSSQMSSKHLPTPHQTWSGSDPLLLPLISQVSVIDMKNWQLLYEKIVWYGVIALGLDFFVQLTM